MADIRKLETAPQMDDYAPAKVTYMGNVIEVVTRQKNSGGCPCIKLDADHYIDTRTGEIMEYSHIENRSESTRSIRNTGTHLILIHRIMYMMICMFRVFPFVTALNLVCCRITGNNFKRI